MKDLFEKRLATMAYITQIQKNGLGKTAMVKVIFLLQTLYKIDLGYRYDIYTYGPYCSEVAADIELAKLAGYIHVRTERYPQYIGYHLSSGDLIDTIISKEQKFISSNKNFLIKVLEQFGTKPVKELELSSTIVFVYDISDKQLSTLEDDVISKVKEIKPHFSIDEIRKEYTALQPLLSNMN